MKRGSIFIAAMALVISVSMGGWNTAQAFETGKFEVGCLVPYATYGDAVDTAVGLNVWMSHGNIFWSFHDQNGVRLGQGFITVQTQIWNYSFSLKTADGNSHPNTVGYLIFTWDDNGTMETTEDEDNLFARAVLLSQNDAAFIPVIPLDRADYANANLSLSAPGGLDADSIVGLSNGFSLGSIAKYWIDPAFNASTKVVIWTAGDAPATFVAGASRVDASGLTGVNMTSVGSRLNVFDVATQVTGLTAEHLDGGLSMNPPGVNYIMFSLIESTTFSAVQTLLAVEMEPVS
jgi:hypothetical protein